MISSSNLACQVNIDGVEEFGQWDPGGTLFLTATSCSP